MALCGSSRFLIFRMLPVLYRSLSRGSHHRSSVQPSQRPSIRPFGTPSSSRNTQFSGQSISYLLLCSSRFSLSFSLSCQRALELDSRGTLVLHPGYLSVLRQARLFFLSDSFLRCKRELIRIIRLYWRLRIRRLRIRRLRIRRLRIRL